MTKTGKEHQSPSSVHTLSLAFDGSSDSEFTAQAPIPEGTYWINPDELWANKWWKPAPTRAWEDLRITIHLTTDMDRFASDLRVRAGTRPCQIPLIVRYP
jgi:hypothetical protein